MLSGSLVSLEPSVAPSCSLKPTWPLRTSGTGSDLLWLLNLTLKLLTSLKPTADFPDPVPLCCGPSNLGCFSLVLLHLTKSCPFFKTHLKCSLFHKAICDRLSSSGPLRSLPTDAFPNTLSTFALFGVILPHVSSPLLVVAPQEQGPFHLNL